MLNIIKFCQDKKCMITQYGWRGLECGRRLRNMRHITLVDPFKNRLARYEFEC